MRKFLYAGFTALLLSSSFAFAGSNAPATTAKEHCTCKCCGCDKCECAHCTKKHCKCDKCSDGAKCDKDNKHKK